MIINPLDHNGINSTALSHNHRPPGAVPERSFVEKCVQCGDCAAVCPSQVIQMDREGFPVVTVAADCGNCGLCADVCMHSCIQLTELTKAGLERVMAEERRLFCV